MANKISTSNNDFLAPGKLSAQLLSELLQQIPTFSSDIIIPPGVGCDAAGVKIGERFFALTTDPITFSTQHVGKFSVAVNINDVVCLGCKPIWFLATLLLPTHISEDEVRNIWRELNSELQRYNTLLIGGHTEITPSVNSPIIIGHMIGEAVTDKLLNIRKCKPGNSILMWRPTAIEGTALIANEKAEQLTQYFSSVQIKQMQYLLDDPGICIYELIEKLLMKCSVTALHDPTEGGVATALHEIADAAKCGLYIEEKAIPILAETIALAKIFKLDPLGLLASGSVLIVCDAEQEAAIFAALVGDVVAKIGTLTSDNSRIIKTTAGEKPLPRYDNDEIIKALNN